MTQYRENEFRKFAKTLKGYDVEEVDTYIREFFKEHVKIQEEINKLKSEINEYKSQENYLKSALITAEQVASNTKLNAEKEADEIISNSKAEAQQIIQKASISSDEYKEKIFRIFYGYEHEIKIAIENFYSKARIHMEELEREFMDEIEKIILRYNSDFKKVLPPEIQSKKNTNVKKDPINRMLRNSEDYIFVGKRIKEDLKDLDGTTILDKDTIVTPKIIESIIQKGLYGELIVALDEG